MAAKVRRCCCRHKNKPKQTKKQVNQEKRSYLPLLRKRSTRMPPLKRTATWRMSSWVLPRRTPPKKMVGLGKAIPRAGALSPSAAGTLSFEHARSTENALINFLVLAVFGSIWGAAAWIQSDKALSFPSETIEFSEITSLFDEWKSGKNPPRYKIDIECSSERSVYYPLSIKDVVLSKSVWRDYPWNSPSIHHYFGIYDRTTAKLLIQVECEEKNTADPNDTGDLCNMSFSGLCNLHKN